MSTVAGRSILSKTGQNSLVKASISKAEQIQQREQLRQKVLSIFLKDYNNKGSKTLAAAIEAEVDAFFKNDKVNEASLKELKSRVLSLVNGKAPSSIASRQANAPQQAQQEDAKSVRSQASVKSQVSSHSKQHQQQQDNVSVRSGRDGDAYSDTSSRAPPSVYYLEGNEDDEWATIVKFDTELFKKEQELEKQRNAEFKKKMKNELDKQVVEKSGKKVEEKQETNAYVQLQDHQLNVYDERERQKEEDKYNKIMNEKRQRDQQVRDVNQRKKQEQKREKNLDAMLVAKIKEEKELEEKEARNKKEKERDRLAQMMYENEEYRRKVDAQTKEEKASDVRLQQEYTRLTEEMEAARDREKKQREDKIKTIMSAFADTVVKDQKAVIREEDDKMMRHILDQEEKNRQEDERKLQNQRQQKQDMRAYLNKQMDEKHKRQVQDDQINSKQAEIWAKDRENFMQHEQQKQEYISMVNKKHQDILKQQMAEKSDPKKAKMNVNELLQNKALFEEIAQKNEAVNFKKAAPNAVQRK